MSKREFEALLNRHEEADHDVDWTGQKEQWLEYVRQFFETVEQWLSPYVKQSRLDHTYEEKEIREEHIGRYSVKVMHIQFAGQEVILEPIGTVLIGSMGRIDMEGVRGRVQFVLADKSSKGVRVRGEIQQPHETTKVQKPAQEQPIEWTWKIVARDPRGVRFDNFTEENFFDALMEVSGE
jgi:hypothetical protein